MNLTVWKCNQCGRLELRESHNPILIGLGKCLGCEGQLGWSVIGTFRFETVAA